jgi:hypothetical protein
LKTSDVVAARAMTPSYTDIGMRQAGGTRRVPSDNGGGPPIWGGPPILAFVKQVS